MFHAIIYDGRAEEEGDDGGAYLGVRLVLRWGEMRFRRLVVINSLLI